MDGPVGPKAAPSNRHLPLQPEAKSGPDCEAAALANAIQEWAALRSEEARFRASLVQSHSLTAGKPSLLKAATRVVTDSGSERSGPQPGYAKAINALSLGIDRLGVGSEDEI